MNLNLKYRPLVLALVALMVGANSFGLSNASASQPITGYVTCISQNPVVGVWIAAQNGGSVWATWTPNSGAPYYANYKFSLSKGGSFSVHVGCGGNPSHWATDNHSGYVQGSGASFTCIDVRGQYRYLTCIRS